MPEHIFLVISMCFKCHAIIDPARFAYYGIVSSLAQHIAGSSPRRHGATLDEETPQARPLRAFVMAAPLGVARRVLDGRLDRLLRLHFRVASRLHLLRPGLH